MKYIKQNPGHLPSLLACLLAAGCAATTAQGQPPAGNEEAPTPREAAPFDITGYWVSVVTEDWRWRMLTPPPGDTGSIPLNAAGREEAEAWTPPAGDTPSCEVFGAAGIIRQPGRLHISWEDEDTLRIDFSAGDQTRLLHFDERARIDDIENIEPSLQGFTTANWYKERQTRGLGFGGPVTSFEGGNLRSETTNLLPGYLQRNGVPYSAETVVEDYYKVINGPAGDKWLIVTTVVNDPVYLRQNWITSTNFKLEENDENWDPRDCE